MRKPMSAGFAIGVLAAVAAGAIGIASNRDPQGSDYDRAAFRASQAAVRATLGGTIISVDQQTGKDEFWEVEVTKLDGRRVDVLLSDQFNVIRIEPQLDASRGAAPIPDPGDVDTEQIVPARYAGPAARAALKAMGGGTVRDVDRGSETGAAWEVEVAGADGSRTDVLLDAQLKVVGIHIKQAPEAPDIQGRKYV